MVTDTFIVADTTSHFSDEIDEAIDRYDSQTDVTYNPSGDPWCKAQPPTCGGVPYYFYEVFIPFGYFGQATPRDGSSPCPPDNCSGGEVNNVVININGYWESVMENMLIVEPQHGDGKQWLVIHEMGHGFGMKDSGLQQGDAPLCEVSVMRSSEHYGCINNWNGVYSNLKFHDTSFVNSTY
jgi:hypothetical protein